VDRIYKVKEAAEQLRVHPMTVYNLIQRRELEAIRIGKTKGLRITEKALSDFIERRTLTRIRNGSYYPVHRQNKGDENQ